MPRKPRTNITVPFLLPSTAVNEIELIISSSNEYRIKPIWRLKYYRLLDYIIQKTHFERGKVLGKDYVNINVEVTADMLSVDKKQMSTILRRLVEHEVLKSDNKMKIQVMRWEGCKRIIAEPGKSFGYTVTNTALTNLSIPDQRGMVERSFHVKDGKSTILDAGLRSYHDILLSLDVDEGSWETAVEKILSSKQSDSEVKREYKNHVYPANNNSNNNDYIYGPLEVVIVPEQESDETTIARCGWMYGKIKSGQLAPVRRGTSRVHSLVNCLYRELRPSLRLDGKPLVGIDIRNSQPLIACILIREYWMSNYDKIPEDVIEYQRCCEQGTFYDYFMSHFQIPVHLRSEFKRDFFAKVYFSMETNKTNKLKEMFKRKYPSVWEAILSIKGGYNSKTYADFAIALQRKEAEIIFNDVVIGLVKDGIKSVCIYDAVYVTDREALAKAILMLRKAFRKHGLSPRFNYENKQAVAKNLVGKNSHGDFT